MTVSKLIERDVNQLSLGYLTHTGQESSLNQILTPAMLKLNGLSQRAPVGVFTLPEGCQGLMKKIEEVYSLYYKVFSTAYIPQLMDRDKWDKTGEQLRINDIVYFKLLDSPLGATWRYSKVDHCKVSRDGICRIVGIAHVTPRGDTQVVERSVRDVVKLLNVEDTSLMDQIKEIQNLTKDKVEKRDLLTSEEADKMCSLMVHLDPIIDIVKKFQSEGFTLVDDIEMDDGFIPIGDYIDVLEQTNRNFMKMVGLL